MQAPENMPNHRQYNRDVEPPYSQIEITEESFKIGMLGAELFQNCFKLFGYDRLGTFLSHCRQGVDWICKNNSMVNCELFSPLQNVINSPTDLANFCKALRDIADLISTPVGMALKCNPNSSELTSLLSQAHQAYLSKSLDMRSLEIELKNLDTSTLDLTLTTPQDKQKISAMKVNSLIDSLGIMTNKTGMYELFTCLTLLSTLTRAYILYLDKTNTPPEELLKILKTETELTLKLQEKKLQNALLHSEFIKNISPEEQVEILNEIHDLFVTHLDLILISKNDWIHQELIEYKEILNNLYSTYDLKTDELNSEIDILIEKTKFLVNQKEEIEKQGKKIVEDYKNLITKEIEKTEKFLVKFKEKISDHDFKKFIEPEFTKTLADLNRQLIESNNDLLELLPDQKHGVAPFSLMSIEEQRAWYTNIKEKYGPQQKQELINMVKYVCRQA